MRIVYKMINDGIGTCIGNLENLKIVLKVTFDLLK